jgi:hypothetical protein
MCFVPWRTMASWGTTSALEMVPTSSRTRTDIPAKSAPFSLGTRAFTRTLRVAGSTRGSTASTRASKRASHRPTIPSARWPTAIFETWRWGRLNTSSRGSTWVISTIGSPGSTYCPTFTWRRPSTPVKGARMVVFSRRVSARSNSPPAASKSDFASSKACSELTLSARRDSRRARRSRALRRRAAAMVSVARASASSRRASTCRPSTR